MPRIPHPRHLARLLKLPHARRLLNADGSVRLDMIPDSEAAFVQLDPVDLGPLIPTRTPLFGSRGVSYNDCDQRNVADCYLIAALRQLGLHMPHHIYHLCQYLPNAMARVFYWSSTGVADTVDTRLTIPQAQINKNPGIWGAVMEKAWCQERTGANTYASINMGNSLEVWMRLGYAATYKAINFAGVLTVIAANLAARIPQVLSSIATPTDTRIVGTHAYGIVACDGKTVTVDNPWDTGRVTIDETSLKTSFNGIFWSTGRSKALPALLTDTPAQKLAALMASAEELHNRAQSAGRTLPVRQVGPLTSYGQKIQGLETLATDYVTLLRAA